MVDRGRRDGVWKKSGRRKRCFRQEVPAGCNAPNSPHSKRRPTVRECSAQCRKDRLQQLHSRGRLDSCSSLHLLRYPCSVIAFDMTSQMVGPEPSCSCPTSYSDAPSPGSMPIRATSQDHSVAAASSKSSSCCTVFSPPLYESVSVSSGFPSPCSFSSASISSACQRWW